MAYSGAKKVGRSAKKTPLVGLAQSPWDRNFGMPLHSEPHVKNWTRSQQTTTKAQADFNQYFAAALLAGQQALRGQHLFDGKQGAYNPEKHDSLTKEHLLHMGSDEATQLWSVVQSMRELLSYNTNSKAHKTSRMEWVRRHKLGPNLCRGTWLLKKVCDLAKWCRFFAPS